MKNSLIKLVVSFLGIFSLMVFLLSCPNISHFHEEGSKANVYISIIDSSVRTVFPQVSLEDATSYKLFGVINGAPEAELVVFTTGGISLSLEPGIWNFTLDAYNNLGKYILQGKVQNKQIAQTGNNQVSFSLSTLNSGIGAIQITLNFPVAAGITRIGISGDLGSEDFSVISDGEFIYIEKNDKRVNEIIVALNNLIQQSLKTKTIGFRTGE